MYGTGVLDVFIENDIVFDYCISVSSGCANAASFLASQKGRNYRFYKVHAMDKRYLSFSNYLNTGSAFGLEYIFDTLTNDVDPLDYDALSANESEYKVVATHLSSGKPHYFKKSDISKGNYKVFMASCAVPVACKPVEIDNRFYYDGGIADPIPVQKCLDDGCDKIVAIIPRSVTEKKQPEKMMLAYKAIFRQSPAIFELMKKRHIIYNNSVELLKKLENEGRAIIVSPSSNINATMFTKKPESLLELYKIGVADGQRVVDKFKTL